jgi:hypothetical protein
MATRNGERRQGNARRRGAAEQHESDETKSGGGATRDEEERRGEARQRAEGGMRGEGASRRASAHVRCAYDKGSSQRVKKKGKRKRKKRTKCRWGAASAPGWICERKKITPPPPLVFASEGVLCTCWGKRNSQQEQVKKEKITRQKPKECVWHFWGESSHS